MNSKAKTFWEMERESISYVHKNENLWSKWAVIAANVTMLEANEGELNEAFKAQDANDPGGHVAMKNELLEKFFHKTYRLGRKLLLYAKDTNDQLLMNEVSFTESTLNKLNEKEALLKCGSILQRGNEYLAKTAGYGITAEELKALAAELVELETLQPTIGIVTNERKSAVRSVKMLIKEGTFITSSMMVSKDLWMMTTSLMVGLPSGRSKGDTSIKNLKLLLLCIS